jgi:glycosyltransferase involved in cell wall biosynthesis
MEHVWSKLIVRHPEAELVILGGVESADARFFTPLLRQSGVRLISQFVDTAPLLASCALTINPQQEIRGSALKVAESLLSRRVCVSTAHGARGFDHLDASSLRICSDWSVMLNELDQLLTDPARRRQLEVCSPEVRASLSWDGKAQQLFELYRSLIPHHFTSGTYS